ncbi:MAG: enoyl-CoA hydratase/isomerase family protein [Planctomycetaceae bacterium]|nr:enoyl-CoA hydratase/isomerase family protein [Planctomycetaceae bacterium]
MAEPLILARTDGDLHHVILNRPEKRNAITPEMLEQIGAAVAQADALPAVRAVIVSGAGPIFSAGIDLMSLAQSKADTAGVDPGRWLRRLADRLQYALHMIEGTEVPVIGALHGQVMGLGLELALAFDLRVAAADLKLSIPEARLGLVADVGGTTRLCRTVGPARAKDMLFTARPVEADEALAWGLVNRVVPTSDVLQCAADLGRQIAANAPLAVGMAKRIVDQGDGLDKHTQMALERWAQSQLITTADVGEAMAAFFEKRPPKFQGR